MSITIHKGSILALPVDTIVNPANLFLRHGAGLAAVIERAATNNVSAGFDAEHEDTEAIREWYADNKSTPTVATGDAVWTSAGVLPFKGVVHAVGPVWSGGRFYERALLGSAHKQAAAVAHDHGCQSVAFPAISCGLFRFPVAFAALIAVEALRPWATPQPNGIGMDITFALMEDEHVRAYRAAAEAAGIKVALTGDIV